MDWIIKAMKAYVEHLEKENTKLRYELDQAKMTPTELAIKGQLGGLSRSMMNDLYAPKVVTYNECSQAEMEEVVKEVVAMEDKKPKHLDYKVLEEVNKVIHEKFLGAIPSPSQKIRDKANNMRSRKKK